MPEYHKRYLRATLFSAALCGLLAVSALVADAGLHVVTLTRVFVL
jgi:hypothetical protein